MNGQDPELRYFRRFVRNNIEILYLVYELIYYNTNDKYSVFDFFLLEKMIKRTPGNTIFFFLLYCCHKTHFSVFW